MGGVVRVYHSAASPENYWTPNYRSQHVVIIIILVFSSSCVRSFYTNYRTKENGMEWYFFFPTPRSPTKGIRVFGSQSMRRQKKKVIITIFSKKTSVTLRKVSYMYGLRAWNLFSGPLFWPRKRVTTWNIDRKPIVSN